MSCQPIQVRHQRPRRPVVRLPSEPADKYEGKSFRQLVVHPWANHSNILRLLFANFHVFLQVRTLFVVLVTEYAYKLFLRFFLVCFQMRSKLSFRTASKKNFSAENTIIVEIKMSIQVMFQGCFEATFRTLEAFFITFALLFKLKFK